MKRYVKASTSNLTEQQKRSAIRVYNECQKLLDIFEDLPTGTIDKLGDIGFVYQELIDDLPGLHEVLFGDDEVID